MNSQTETMDINIIINITKFCVIIVYTSSRVYTGECVGNCLKICGRRKHGSMTGSGAASGQPMGRVYLHVFVLGFFCM